MQIKGLEQFVEPFTTQMMSTLAHLIQNLKTSSTFEPDFQNPKPLNILLLRIHFNLF